MISLLITILIFALVAGVVWYIIRLIPLPPPFGLIVQLVFLLICVLVLISFLLPFAGMPIGYGGYYHQLR